MENIENMNNKEVAALCFYEAMRQVQLKNFEKAEAYAKLALKEDYEEEDYFICLMAILAEQGKEKFCKEIARLYKKAFGNDTKVAAILKYCKNH